MVSAHCGLGHNVVGRSRRGFECGSGRVGTMATKMVSAGHGECEDGIVGYPIVVFNRI